MKKRQVSSHSTKEFGIQKIVARQDKPMAHDYTESHGILQKISRMETPSG